MRAFILSVIIFVFFQFNSFGQGLDLARIRGYSQYVEQYHHENKMRNPFRFFEYDEVQGEVYFHDDFDT